jgi:hypothetical protein
MYEFWLKTAGIQNIHRESCNRKRNSAVLVLHFNVHCEVVR